MSSLQKNCKATDKFVECKGCEKQFRAPCSNRSDNKFRNKNQKISLGIAKTVVLFLNCHKAVQISQ